MVLVASVLPPSRVSQNCQKKTDMSDWTAGFPMGFKAAKGPRALKYSQLLKNGPVAAVSAKLTMSIMIFNARSPFGFGAKVLRIN